MSSFECNKCGQTLSSKRALDRHLLRKYPCDRKYTCSKCGRNFRDNHALSSHMSRKKPCGISRTCKYCDKEFTDIDEYCTHFELCAVNAIVSKSGDGPSVNINIQNNTVNVGNLNVYVFGKESTKHIDMAKVGNMLEGSLGQFLPNMVKYVHTDPLAPENNNVVFDPESNKFYLMVQPDVWTEEDADSTMLQLRDNIQRHIQLLQPKILPYITINSKDNCEALLMGKTEYRDMTSETVDKTKKVLEDPIRVEKIKAITN